MTGLVTVAVLEVLADICSPLCSTTIGDRTLVHLIITAEASKEDVQEEFDVLSHLSVFPNSSACCHYYRSSPHH